jgi:C4-dicarboxylate-specific signal transduction histidine kinase
MKNDCYKIQILATFTTSIRNKKYGITIEDNAQDEITRNSNLAVIDEMSANISHEVNNPTTVISLLTKKIRKLLKEMILINFSV